MALVLWGSDLTYVQEVRLVDLDEQGDVTIEHVSQGLVEGNESVCVRCVVC